MEQMCVLLALMRGLCEQTESICRIRQELRADFYNRLQSQMVGIQKTVSEEMWNLLNVDGRVEEGVCIDAKEGMERSPEAGAIDGFEEAFPGEPFVFEDTDDIAQDTAMASSEEGSGATSKSEEEAIFEPVAIQDGPSRWIIKAGVILCQAQDITVTRDGRQESMRFYISPLEKAEDGIVPILVGSEYKSTYGVKQSSTAMSENGDSLLQMDINDYSFLIKGSFEGGVFSTSITTTGRSIGCGDILNVNKIYPVSGTEAVPLIVLNEKTNLLISFFEEQYFGMVHSGEWLDEYNATHDAMVEVGDDYSELRTSRTESGWSLEY